MRSCDAVTESAHSTSKPRGLAALASSAPSDGALRGALMLVVTLIASLAAWHAFATSSQKLVYPDAFDYAQMGRQVSRGEGMTSLQIFPYALGRLEAGGHDVGAPWPNMWRFPLPVLARAASFTVLGESDAAALLPALVFSVLTATLLFALGNQLGGPVAGGLAAALWIASASQRWFAVTGLAEPGAAMLAVAIALFALRAKERTSLGSAAMLGLLIGAAVLHRSNLLALAPIATYLVWSATTQGRPARLLALGLAALAVAAPWWLRNAALFGEPLLNLTTERGLLRLALGADPFFTLGDAASEAHVLKDSLVQYPSRWTLTWFAHAGPLMLGREFSWLFAASTVLLPLDLWRRRSSAPVWAMAFGGIFLTALVFVPIYPHVVRFYWPYAPILLALTSASACSELSRSKWARATPAAGLVAFALFAALTPRENTAPVMPASRTGLELADIAKAVAPGETVASDVSYALAWQVGQPSIRIMGNYDVVAAIDARILPLRTIHVVLDKIAARPLSQAPLSERYTRVLDDPDAGLLYTSNKKSR